MQVDRTVQAWNPINHKLQLASGAIDMGPLMEELVEEILLRVPPDDPTHLIRAALVCKAWRGILSDYGFRRRYYRFHRAAPPLLGYIRHLNVNSMPEFVAVFSPAAAATVPTGSAAGVHAYGIDSRHGRVLIHDESSPAEPGLVVWDPITGGQESLSMPPAFRMSCPFFAAAVLCARHLRGCDHLDCHGGPFLVVFAGARDDDVVTGAEHNWVAVYSSQTRAWSAAETSGNNDYYGSPRVSRPSLLIGDTLHFALFTGGVPSILKYDLASGGVHGQQRLSVIDDAPQVFRDNNVVPIEMDGGLGFVEFSFRNRIYTWSRQQADPNNVVGGGWMRDHVVDLETLILTRRRAPYHHDPDDKIRFAEGTNMVLVSMNNRIGFGVFTINLKSGHVSKIAEAWDTTGVLPYMSFYTPGGR